MTVPNSRLVLAIGLLLCALASPGLAATKRTSPTPAKAPPSADTRLREIYTAEWKWRSHEESDSEDDEGKIADHLPRVDNASQEKRLSHWRATLAALDDIPVSQLSAKERLNYDIYRPQIEILVRLQEMRDYEMPVNSDSAFWTGLTYTARSTFRTPDDYRRWIQQMKDIPRFFAEETAQMRAGLARGFTPPQVTLAGRDGSLAPIVDTSPEKTFFYLPFEKMTGVAEADRAALRAEAVSVIQNTVQPAYRQMLDFFRNEYVPHTRTTLAAVALPDGEAYYRTRIQEFTTLDLSPAEIHAFGVSEVERLHAEMVEAMKSTGWTGSFDDFLAMLRSDSRFTVKTPEELLMHASWVAKRFDEVAGQYFGRLPRARFAIRPVPDELAPFYTAGRGGNGVYLLNTYNLPSRTLYNLPALTLHESAPGHAWQGSLALEHKDQPEFRQHTYISAYGEGWALYCERLGVEMGIYRNPYEHFGMLGYQIWRATRLVVDTGVHTQGWTRQQAIDYLLKYTTLPAHEVETEVDRYIAWPGQALSYYLGETEIVKARARSEAALGAKFNLRAFHDTILELGSVPMSVLQARIDRFIAEGGKGPYPDEE
jgi:uncharacterized protein (DUF885 family)